MNYLYAFIDVSGNYDFSIKGTKHLVLTSLICTDVNPGVLELHALKHNMIDKGIDLEYFHASEDRQTVRDGVFDIISHLNHIRIDSLILDKSKTAPSLRPPKRFYPTMVENLLKYPFDPRGIDVRRFDKVFIFVDRESSRASERDALTKAMKLSLARHLLNVPYVICMHPSISHPYLQIVDYCCWAIYVKNEREEYRPYEKIMKLVKSEFNIFASGEIKWS
jgi:hypothetical protein